MEISEYIEKKRELTEQHDRDMVKLNREYALSNNTVKVGDTVKSNRVAIIVDNIRIGRIYRTEEPCCVYFGVMLTKKGRPYKSGERNSIWQNDVIE
jgi:hypothetical protein